MTEFKTPITFEDVVEATNALRAEGIKVSTLSVREKLGRGSFSTVKKFLDRLAAEGRSSAAAPPVPTQLESLWNEAQRVANESLEQERIALETLASELDARLALMEAAVHEATSARHLAEARLADRQDELERTLRLVEELRSQRDRSETLRETAESALEIERRSAEQRWQQVNGVLASIRGSVSEIERQGIATTDLVASSARAISTELAEHANAERRSRITMGEDLRGDLARLVEPLASLPATFSQFQRQWHRLTRKVSGLTRRGPRSAREIGFRD